MKKKYGFTLLETLLVVGIITILLAIGIVNVAKYQRSLCQLELDGIAKEIFVAAQNHLSAAYGQNYLGHTDAGKSEKDMYTPVASPTVSPLDEDGVYCFIVGNDRSALTGDSLLSLMLPSGSVDETVRQGGSYIIRYNKDAGLVLDVFYARLDGERYGHTLAKEDYWSDSAAGDPTFMTVEDGKFTLNVSKTDRRNYSNSVTGADGAVIGYYGGVEADPVVTEGLPKPVLQLVNGDRLEASVTNLDDIKDCLTKYPDAKLKLVVEGVSSGKSKVFWDDVYLKDLFSASVILDDVTNSAGENRHFAYLFPEFIPGEDIRVTAIVYDAKTGVQSESDVRTENSLFAKLSGTTADIGNFRHLENLEPSISGRSVTLKSAEQTTDLIWSGSFYTDYVITDKSGNTKAEKGYYFPVDLLDAYVLTYDGKNYTVSGISVSNAGDSGMFGILNDSTVKNLILTDFDIKAASGNAGALAGSANGKAAGEETTFSNILAYHTTDSTAVTVTAVNCAGGLVGYANNCTVDGCAAALYVVSNGDSANAIEGFAGGLIGKMNGGTVKDSFSGGHTNNAIYIETMAENNAAAMNGTAGGFIGETEGTVTIDHAYSTCSAGGVKAAAGFIGNNKGTTTVNTCYAVGYVGGSTSNKNYFYNGTALTFKGKNYYLDNIVSLTSQDNSSGRTTDYLKGVNGSKNVGTESPEPDFILLKANRSTAFVYDTMLRRDFESKFYFKTISQLDTSYTGTLLQTHYGDWEVPDLKGIVLQEHNADVLYVYTTLEEKTLSNLTFNNKKATATFAVKGVESGKSDLFEIEITENGGSYDAEIVKVWRDGDDKWTEKANFTDSIKRYFPEVSVVPVEGKPQLRIELDDITEPYQHFAERFPNMYPGENIELYFKDGVQSVTSAVDKNEYYPCVCNSLFGTSSAEGAYTNALISTVRHLQNLDPMVSNVKDSITQASLNKDITFNSSVYQKIYSADSTKYTDGYFYALYNPKLTAFNGNNHTLTGFSFRSPAGFTVGGASGAHSGNAGLFRYVGGNMTISKLRLNECDMIGDSNAHAGGIVAEIAGSGAVTLDTVLVTADFDYTDENTRKNSRQIQTSGTGCAGGLVGYSTASGSLSIKNSAATIQISAAGGGSAGGLLGQQNGAGGTVTIQNSYAGGHTDGKAYSRTYYNVVSRGNAAGGLVGYAAKGAGLVIEKAFSAASVAASSASGANTYPAGGLIGRTDIPTTVNTAYTIAPVYDTLIYDSTGKYLNDGSGNAGAVIGVIGASGSVGTTDGKSSYYLAEVFDGYENGRSFVTTIGTNKDKCSVTLDYAYYDQAENSAVAAKREVNKGYMQTKTFVYDEALKYRDGVTENGEYEFPFTVWNTFSFIGGNGIIYYGDWQPVMEAATQTVTVTFKYTNPITGETKTAGTKTLIVGRDNMVLIPYMESVKGYEITKWNISDTTDSIVYSGDGSIVLSKNYCSVNRTLTAVFQQLEDYYTIIYYYDPSGANASADMKMIGSPELVKKADGKKLSDCTPPIRSITGYLFEDWYSDKELTKKLDFSGNDKITKNITAYAKYIPFQTHTLTVDFVYVTDEERAIMLGSLARYDGSIDSTGKYSIAFSGNEFEGDIMLPVLSDNSLSVRSVGNYEDAAGDLWSCSFFGVDGDGKKTTLTPSNTRTDSNASEAKGVHLHAKIDTAHPADSEKYLHFVVVYRDKTDDVDYYRIKYVLENTTGTKPNYSSKTGSTAVFESYDRTVKSGKEPQVAVYTGDSTGYGYLQNFNYIKTEKTKITDGKDPDNSSKRLDYIITVYYQWSSFSLSYDTDCDTTYETQTLTVGTSLADYLKETPKQENYTFLGWKIRVGEKEYKVTDTDRPTTMPASDVTLVAEWKPGDAVYHVIFETENADNDAYSFIGSVDFTAGVGSKVYYTPPASVAAHTHTDDCFADIIQNNDLKFVKSSNSKTLYQFSYKSGFSTYTINAELVEGTTIQNGSKVKYNNNVYTISKSGNNLQFKIGNTTYTYAKKTVTDTVEKFTYHGVEVTFEQPASPANGYIASYTDANGGSGKCMYYKENWYYYNGLDKAGEIASCAAGKLGSIINGIDSRFFNAGVSDAGDEAHAVTVKADGSTIITVKYTRKVFRLRFVIGYVDGSTLYSSTAKDNCPKDYNNFYTSTSYRINFGSVNIVNGKPVMTNGNKTDLDFLLDINKTQNDAVLKGRVLNITKDTGNGTSGTIMAYCLELTAKYDAAIDQLWPDSFDPIKNTSTGNTYILGGWPYRAGFKFYRDKNGGDSFTNWDYTATNATWHDAFKGTIPQMSEDVILTGVKNGGYSAVPLVNQTNWDDPANDNSITQEFHVRLRISSDTATNVHIYANYFQDVNGNLPSEPVYEGPYYGGSTHASQQPATHSGFTYKGRASNDSSSSVALATFTGSSDTVLKNIGANISKANLSSTSLGKIYIERFEFTRNKYPVTFIVDNKLVETRSLYYQTDISGIENEPVNTSVFNPNNRSTTLYRFSGWYQDSEFKEKFVFSKTVGGKTVKTTLPLDGVILYGRWEAIPAQVNFYLNADDMAASANRYASVSISAANRSIDKDGQAMPANPSKTDKIFNGWVYTKPDSSTARFYKTSPIDKAATSVSDGKLILNVYADWRDKATAGKKGTVTVYYKGADGKDLPGSPKRYTGQEVNSVFSAVAQTYSDYYSDLSVSKITVFADEDIYMEDRDGDGIKETNRENVIIFHYSEAKSWNYQVQYYIRLANLGGITKVNDIDLSTSSELNKLGDIAINQTPVVKTATTHYASIQIDLSGEEGISEDFLEGYDQIYRICGYAYDEGAYQAAESTTVMVSAPTNTTKTPLLKVYLEVDPTRAMLFDKEAVYNGSNHADVSAIAIGADDTDNKTIQTIHPVLKNDKGNVYQWKIYNLYEYFNADGTTLTSIINAGAYRMNGYAVLCLQTGETLETAEYKILINAETAKSLNLFVVPRQLLVTSKSDTRKYIENTPLKRDTVEDYTAVVQNDTGKAFVGKDQEKFKVIFSVESFRLNPGVSENSFIYEFTDPDVAENYQIQTQYGTLTVTES